MYSESSKHKKLESSAPMNLLMSTRGPIGNKFENSNDLVLASTRDHAQLMETQERTTSPMTTRNIVSAGLNS